MNLGGRNPCASVIFWSELSKVFWKQVRRGRETREKKSSR